MFSWDIGDVIEFNGTKILVVGYCADNKHRDSTLLHQNFHSANRIKVFKNYIEGKKTDEIIKEYLLENLCYYYLDIASSDDIFSDYLRNVIHSGLALNSDICINGLVIEHKSREFVNNFLLKKQLLGYYDSRAMVDYQSAYDFAMKYKKTFYNEEEVENYLSIERINYKNIVNRPKRDINIITDEMAYRFNFLLTFSKSYMYLYHISFNEITFLLTIENLGRASLSNEEECFKLYLKHKIIDLIERGKEGDVKGDTFIAL